MRVRLISVVLAASLLIGASAAAASAATIVRGRASRWHPAIVRISKGQSVRWKSIDTHHTVASYGTNWTYFKHLRKGTITRPRKFRRKGIYRFYCLVHGSVNNGKCTGMCGKVVVG